MGTQHQPAGAADSLRKYIPLACWAVVLITVLLTALKITSYGFIPGGDARRHYAKVFTDKPYTQIIVMRPEYQVDHSPGWEWLLRMAHKLGGLGMEGLINASVIGTLLLLFVAGLPWLRRPEAWMAALLGQMIAIPELMNRFVQIRPFLVSEVVLIALLFSWSKREQAPPSWLKVGLTCFGFAMSTWIHGAWYLWVLLFVAFFLAGYWREAVWLTGCWVVGTVAGALLTGAPLLFLKQAVQILLLVSGEHAPQWLLVGEFRPSAGEFTTLVLLAVVCFWRRLQNPSAAIFSRLPVVWMIVICWILGFKADRFWADWGVPAVLVFLALQVEELIIGTWGAAAPRRLLATALGAAALFLDATNDLDRRYTISLSETFLDASDPELRGWLPESEGIFYTAQMEFFYNTFFKNPTADWRYIVGMEPALMPEEDLKIYRRVQWNMGAFGAYQPWIDKMRKGDRLAILCQGEPPLSKLEWHRAASGIWIGRLPAQN